MPSIPYPFSQSCPLNYLHLLEKPVNLDTSHIKGRNVVEDVRSDINAVRTAAGAQVNDLCGSLVTIALDGDPFSAVGTIGIVGSVERHNRGAVVIGAAASTETLWTQKRLEMAYARGYLGNVKHREPIEVIVSKLTG